jgi:hypothetical protein
VDGATHHTTGGWVSDRDRAALGALGIVDVRVSDRRSFPALEFSFDGRRCMLAMEIRGDSTLEIGGRPVASFRYESSVELMRYRLVGWDEASALLPRRAVAYLSAMQRCAVAEDALAHPDLFPVVAPARGG